MSARRIASAVPPVSRRFRLRALARASAILGGLAAVACTAPALAAAEVRVPFDQFRQKVCPSSVDTCSANFGVVPADTRLEVKSVSCSLFTQRVENAAPQVAVVEFRVLDATGEIIMRDYAVPFFQAYSHPFGSFFAANNETFFFAPAGGRVQVVMVADGPTGLELDCKIAGERVGPVLDPTP